MERIKLVEMKFELLPDFSPYLFSGGETVDLKFCPPLGLIYQCKLLLVKVSSVKHFYGVYFLHVWLMLLTCYTIY